MSLSSAAVMKPLEGAKTPASSQLFVSPGRRTLVFCLLLITVVLVSYNAVTHNGFVRYDDDEYITDNPHIRAGLTWATVKWAFATYDQANWHPLTWLSHALDCQLFGLHPVGHHYVNVLLHAANVVLLFLLLQNATGFCWRSLMVAALFAVHPINVESVAWAAERKNVLSMLFFLLALYAYGWYSRRPELGRYAAVAFLFALSLLSKPQAITFPLLLLLWDYWPLRRIEAAVASAPSDPATREGSSPRFSPGRLVLEKVPLLLLSAASAVVTMKAQKAGGAVQALSLYSAPLRLETAVISYVAYLGKAFWPSKLVALYPHPTRLYPVWQVAASALLVSLVTVWVLRARDQKYLAVGWFWFLGSLVPMIGLVQVGAAQMADRYAYIPFIGLFLMLVWVVSDWAEAYSIPNIYVAFFAGACLLVSGTLTYRQVGYWHDTQSFWQRTLALTQDNYVAHDNLGEFLFTQDRKDEAAEQFRAALAIRPDDMPANLNLGTYEHGRGNLTAAISRYQTVALNAVDVPLRATAYGNLGSVYRQMGELVAAKRCFETALQLAPDRTMVMIGLGLIAQKEGDLPEAIRQYSHAMAVQPTDVGYLLLAQALQLQGHPQEAKEIVERVARFSANFPEAQKEAESLLSGK
jgi:protein O-mannosyl-transferase